MLLDPHSPHAQFHLLHRRAFLRQLGIGAAAAWVGLAGGRSFAEELLAATPELTEGPFYPDRLPLDTDNDLLIVNESITPAVGEITHLSGRVLTPSGNPLRNAVVEIWQVDSQGIYLHTQDPQHRTGPRDANFQGYGRFLSDSSGAYYFRTIKPVPYPGRTPHIHIAVSRNGERLHTTQILVAGHEQNEGDGVFRAIREPQRRRLLLGDFTRIPDSRLGELSCRFDIILGVTPEDDPGEVHGSIGPRRWGHE